THRSFMEYFVALYLKDALTAGGGSRTELLERELSYEILYFLGAFGLSDSATRGLLRQYYERAEGTGRGAPRRNALIALMFSSHRHEGLKLENVELYNATFQRLKFSKARIVNGVFRRVTYRETEFSEATILNLNLYECNLGSCSFLDSHVEMNL